MIITVDLEKESAEGLRKAAKLLLEAAEGKEPRFERPVPVAPMPVAPMPAMPPPGAVFDLKPEDLGEDEPEPPKAKKEKKDLLSESGIQVY